MKQITLSPAPCSAVLSRLAYAPRLSGISDVSCRTDCVLICRLWSPATGTQVTLCMLVNCLQGFF